jgi:hypothetical protein
VKPQAEAPRSGPPLSGLPPAGARGNVAETSVSVFVFRDEHNPNGPVSSEPPLLPFRITRGRAVTTPSTGTVVHVWYETITPPLPLGEGFLP